MYWVLYGVVLTVKYRHYNSLKREWKTQVIDRGGQQRSPCFFQIFCCSLLLCDDVEADVVAGELLDAFPSSKPAVLSLQGATLREDLVARASCLPPRPGGVTIQMSP